MQLVKDPLTYLKMLLILLSLKELKYLKRKGLKKPVMVLQWLLKILIILKLLFKLKWILRIMLHQIMKLREPNSMDMFCKIFLLSINMLIMGIIPRLEYGSNLIPQVLVLDSLCVELLLSKLELNSKLILDDFDMLKYII